MRLIESLAIVCISAATNFVAAAKLHFDEPVGIRQRLSRHAYDVRLAAPQDCFRLFEGRDASRGNNWCLKSCGVDGVLDCRDERHGAAEWSARVG